MNTTQDILRDAVLRMKPVSFEYRNPKKPAEPAGVRIGNPHAVYATSQGIINVDLYQTGGVLPAGSAALPLWKDYALSYIVGLEILEAEPSFEEAPGYKAYNRKYERKFVKV